MLNIQDLIDMIQGATINITVNVNGVDTDDTVTTDDTVDTTIDFDYDIDDRVLLKHIRKDGEEIYVDGIVVELGEDDTGPYTRIAGDNGKHYKAGAKRGQERKGTTIVR